MMIDPIDLIREKIVPLFEEDLKNLEKASGVCDLLGIPVDGFKVIDSYKTATIQSDVARIFTLESYERIGLMLGTWENPRKAMRFMDYKGATMLIPTNDDQPEFWCGGNYIPKVGPKSPFLMKPLTGNLALNALLDDERDMLVIAITPRKELWFKNLIVGSKSHLVYCTESGATMIPRKGWTELKNEFSKLDKKIRAEAIVVLRGTNKGFYKPEHERVQKFYKDNMDFAISCKKLLPTSPHARSFWLSALGNIE